LFQKWGYLAHGVAPDFTNNPSLDFFKMDAGKLLEIFWIFWICRAA
jgi:hypothetical protein